ncbi:Uncharacterised protein [Vibrio cholerae]|nr:Uncharacterised protein [Vibrio cholerae]
MVKVVDGAMILQQLFHQFLSRQDIRQRDIRRFQQTFGQKGRKGIHAITDHHRAFKQHALQGHRAGGKHHRIGCSNHIARGIIHQHKIQLRSDLLPSLFKLRTTFSIHQGHHKAKIWIARLQFLTGGDKGLREHLHFTATAARQNG